MSERRDVLAAHDAERNRRLRVWGIIALSAALLITAITLTVLAGDSEYWSGEPAAERAPLPTFSLWYEGVEFEIVRRIRCTVERPCDFEAPGATFLRLTPLGDLDPVILGQPVKAMKGTWSTDNAGRHVWVNDSSGSYFAIFLQGNRVVVAHYAHGLEMRELDAE